MITYHTTRALSSTATATSSGSTVTNSYSIGSEGMTLNPYTETGSAVSITGAVAGVTTAAATSRWEHNNLIERTFSGNSSTSVVRDSTAGTSGSSSTYQATTSAILYYFDEEGTTLIPTLATSTASTSGATTGTVPTAHSLVTSSTTTTTREVATTSTNTGVDYEAPTTTTWEVGTTVTTGSGSLTGTATATTSQLTTQVGGYDDPLTYEQTGFDYTTTTASALRVTETTTTGDIDVGFVAKADAGEALVLLESPAAGYVVPASRVSTRSSVSWFSASRTLRTAASWASSSQSVTGGRDVSLPEVTERFHVTTTPDTLSSAAIGWPPMFPGTAITRTVSRQTTSGQTLDSLALTNSQFLFSGQVTTTVLSTVPREGTLAPIPGAPGLALVFASRARHRGEVASTLAPATIVSAVSSSGSTTSPGQGSTSTAQITDMVPETSRPLWTVVSGGAVEVGAAYRTVPAVAGYAPEASGSPGTNLDAPNWPFPFVSQRLGDAHTPVRYPRPQTYSVGETSWTVSFSGVSTFATSSHGTTSGTTSRVAVAAGTRPPFYAPVDDDMFYNPRSTLRLAAGATAWLPAGSFHSTRYGGTSSASGAITRELPWTTSIASGYALVQAVPHLSAASALPAYDPQILVAGDARVD